MAWSTLNVATPCTLRLCDSSPEIFVTPALASSAEVGVSDTLSIAISGICETCVISESAPPPPRPPPPAAPAAPGARAEDCDAISGEVKGEVGTLDIAADVGDL